MVEMSTSVARPTHSGAAKLSRIAFHTSTGPQGSCTSTYRVPMPFASRSISARCCSVAFRYSVKAKITTSEGRCISRSRCIPRRKRSSQPATPTMASILGIEQLRLVFCKFIINKRKRCPIGRRPDVSGLQRCACMLPDDIKPTNGPQHTIWNVVRLTASFVLGRPVTEVQQLRAPCNVENSLHISLVFPGHTRNAESKCPGFRFRLSQSAPEQLSKIVQQVVDPPSVLKCAIVDGTGQRGFYPAPALLALTEEYLRLHLRRNDLDWLAALGFRQSRIHCVIHPVARHQKVPNHAGRDVRDGVEPGIGR